MKKNYRTLFAIALFVQLFLSHAGVQASGLPPGVPCPGDVTPPVFSSGLPAVDQQALVNNSCMANFNQPDLAQSFIPAQITSCGASIFLMANGAGLGDVTIQLWDNLPNAGGNMLAAGTVTAVVDNSWADVTWSSVMVTTGLTYYLVFLGTNGSQCIAGDLFNGYAGGMVFANSGFGAFSGYDYNFKTYSCAASTCPGDTTVYSNSALCGAIVNFATPAVTDDCIAYVPVVTQTTGLPSGSTFPLGTTLITFQATDGNGNMSYCSYNIIVVDTISPVADVADLNTTVDCGITINAPTATDNCSGVITGTTSQATSFNAEGTYTIIWLYDDGNGNNTSQIQVVTVDDATAPVADVASLPDVSGCSPVIVATVPTATDNCQGSITGTTTDPLTYTTVGSYTVTWTYDDGNGNTSTQDQSVTVLDCTGINEIADLNISIYPTLSNGIFTLSLSRVPQVNTEMKLIDVMGRVLYSGSLISQSNYYDFSYLSQGIYYVQIKNATTSFTKAIVIIQKN